MDTGEWEFQGHSWLHRELEVSLDTWNIVFKIKIGKTIYQVKTSVKYAWLVWKGQFCRVKGQSLLTWVPQLSNVRTVIGQGHLHSLASRKLTTRHFNVVGKCLVQYLYFMVLGPQYKIKFECKCNWALQVIHSEMSLHIHGSSWMYASRKPLCEWVSHVHIAYQLSSWQYTTALRWNLEKGAPPQTS